MLHINDKKSPRWTAAFSPSSMVYRYAIPSRCWKLIGLKPCRSFLQNEWRLTYNPCVSWPRWRQKPVSSNSWWKPMTHNVDLSGGNKDIHHAWPIPESRFKKTSVPTAYLICSMYVVHTIYTLYYLGWRPTCYTPDSSTPYVQNLTM